MKFLAIMGLFTILNTQPLTLDFGLRGNNQEWFALNDGVMGGRSDAALRYTDQSFVFKGAVSLENNGGFTSVRSPYRDQDLSGYTSIEIRYRSTGMDFAITLNNSKLWYRPNYKAQLPKTQGQWQKATLTLKDFKEYRIGNPTGNAIDYAVLKKILRLGLISDEKRAGGFEIEVDYLKFK